MVGSNCDNAEVAHIRARDACGNRYFEMNAVRYANDCVEHSLNLALDGAEENPCLESVAYQNRKLETRNIAPVTIEAYQWHQDKKLGKMNLEIEVDLSLHVVEETADLAGGQSWNSTPFSIDDSAIHFLAEDPSWPNKENVVGRKPHHIDSAHDCSQLQQCEGDDSYSSSQQVWKDLH